MGQVTRVRAWLQLLCSAIDGTSQSSTARPERNRHSNPTYQQPNNRVAQHGHPVCDPRTLGNVNDTLTDISVD
jgi:hypothetical protein